MMGIDDMVIGLAISYVAGNVPLIKNWFSGNPSLQKEMDKCYEKALKKWTINDGIRDIARGRKSLQLEELRQILSGEEVADKGYLELVRLWVQEMRGNAICYGFILEHKNDLLAIKLDGGGAKVLQLLTDEVEELRAIRQENNEQHQQVMAKLGELLSAQGNITEEELAGKLMQLIEDVVNKMIDLLRLDSVKELVNEMERLFGSAIQKDNFLHVAFLKAKGDCLSFSNPKKAREAYHKAYLLNTSDERLIELELAMIRKKDLTAAYNLAKQLPENNIKRIVFEVCYSDNPVVAFRNLPERIKANYNLRYLVLIILNEKNVDTSFLFEDETVTEEESLNFHNLFSWQYIMTWHMVKLKGELWLSIQRPLPSEIGVAFETSDKLMRLLQKTDVKDVFAMVEAHHCYWGFALDENPSWIDAIHQIDRSLANEQNVRMNLMEVSMLMISKRFNEAFQMVVTMREDITQDIADFVILMAFHANDMQMLAWVMNLVKEKPYKLRSSAALHIAYCVSHSSASEILKVLDTGMFECENDGVVLRELCNLYDNREVDVESLKAHLDGLSDDMTAYAAQVLSQTGDAQMAFDLLQPKVGTDKSSLRQRIFLGIMAMLPEKQPELYTILLENRRNGNPCDDELLSIEYSLETRVGDYQNAFEAVSILYERRPDSEPVLVNYLRMLGRFDAKSLEKKRDEVLNHKFTQLANVQQVYQVFMENKYADIAAEVLYNYVKDSTDIEARTFYYMESVTGMLGTVVNQQYTIAKEGLFAICDRGDGERAFFEVKIGDEVGETLIGMKEGERFTAKQDGIEGEYVLTHIVNKYGKLEAEISLEVAQGNNPYFKVMHIDMSNPLDSLLEQLAIVSPDSVNYYKDKQLAEEKYEKGEIGILNFVRDDDLIGDYYSRLFSSSKVFVAPCQVFDSLGFQGGVPDGMRYVLDITGMLTLFEFQQKNGCQYNEKFLIPSTTYELVLATLKNSGKMAMNSYSEALRGGAIVKYKDYIDLDLEIRMNKLVKWIDDNCEKLVSDKFLSFDVKEQKSMLHALTMNTLTLMLEPDRCLITDDQIIESCLRSKTRVITTEAYMRNNGNDKDISEYMSFVAACNYIGVFLDSEYIYNEYMKMERGQENRFNYVVQNAAYNQVLVTNIIRAAVKIMAEAKDSQLVTMTLTNLMAVMISAISASQKSIIVANLMKALPSEYWNTAKVRQCLQDAAKINNVIMLPGYYGM